MATIDNENLVVLRLNENEAEALSQLVDELATASPAKATGHQVTVKLTEGQRRLLDSLRYEF